MPFRTKAAAVILALFVSIAHSGDLSVGKIETIREDGYLTVIFDSIPEREKYIILSGDKKIGSIHSLNRIESVHGRIRYMCRFSLTDEGYRKVLRAGLDIVIHASDKEIDKRVQKNPYIDTTEFKREIVSNIDGREMVFIPAGKFQMGCSVCDDDEYPERTEFLGDYYIDKFEVSNSDYKRYADINGVAYPEYWRDEIDESGSFVRPYFSSLPVIVTYHEGAGYAKWAGKRLPKEHEWEKGARRPGQEPFRAGGGLYSWGTGFKHGISNTEELWLSDKTGENLKKIVAQRYNQINPLKGYLPVELYDSESISYYGVVNMDGNALEWTDSWYAAYPGNTKANKRYGTQYKVVRGGSFFLPAKDARITDRKVGGIPDLYRDRLAGFRCVKMPVESDKKH